MKYKYIVLSFLAVLLTIPSYSQSLKELLEGESKYIAKPTREATDTIPNSITTTSVDEPGLVFKAVAPALKIVKQQYRLEKNGDFFGRNNNPHFGETYSLAVKISGGTILQHKVLYPWVNDKDYKDANESGKYTPVLYSSYQKSVTGGEYEKIDFELETPYVKQVGKDSLLYIHSDVYSDFGLNMDTVAGEKGGYMLWVYEKDGKYNYKVESLDLKASADSTVFPINPSNQTAMLGGVYIIPVNERPGTISFHLVGVASTYNNQDWFLILLTKCDANINIVK